jgi:ribonuclease D
MTQQPSTPDLPPPVMVDTPNRAEMLRDELAGARRLAVDTEANSLHAYDPQVCLIQISTDKQDYLVDPLRLNGYIDFLGRIFADPDVEKVFHAAEYDVMILRRDFGFDFENLFDTEIAARVLGWERFGLGSILEEHYGVGIDKSHQRADWGRRPLPDGLIRYARLDTHYLLDLRDEMAARLEAGDHVEEAQEMFDEVSEAVWSGEGFDPDGYWRIHEARDLSPQEMAVLRELYHYREHQARKRDVPVFKVMGKKTLVALAQAMPRSLGELSRIRGISDYHVRHYGRGIVRLVEVGLEAEPPTRPPREGERPSDDVLHRYDALHTWRKERAARRGVSSEIVLSKDALWELARRAPRTQAELAEVACLGPWRRKTYGDEILSVIRAEDGR